MSSFRFVHCSDLHIDSPFKGISWVDPALRERLRGSTLGSFSGIIDLALREKVDAVIIAGDVFDGADKSLKAQLKFRDELQRLADADIPSFIAHGNHDPLDTWASSLQWPSNVTIFSGDDVESVPIRQNGKEVARVYGVSFPQRSVTHNLALKFQKREHEGFAIAVLHANVGGNTDHDNYSPCSVADLIGRGMDYWALGHVHARQVLRAYDPAIVYPGNSQARNIRETGAKGCCLVTLTTTAPPSIEFFPTDVIRYFSEQIDLSNCSAVNEVLEKVQSHCERLSDEADGRDIMARLTLVGQTPIHRELSIAKDFADLQEAAQDCFSGREPMVGVELVRDTRETFDVDDLSQGKGFVADIIALYAQAENDQTLLQEMRKELKPLFEEWAGRKRLEKISDLELKKLALKARDRTIGQLINPGG